MNTGEYEVLAALPSSPRMMVEQIRLATGQLAVRKTGLNELARELVDNQAEAGTLINTAGGMSSPSFRAPDAIAIGPGQLIMEDINTTPLSKRPLDSQVAEVLAGIAFGLDAHGATSDEPPRYSHFDDFEPHLERVRGELQPFVAMGVIPYDLVTSALHRLTMLHPLMHSRLQHGDLSRQHVYPDPRQPDPDKLEHLVTIDLEYTWTRWPEHYDFANLLVHFVVSEPNIGFAREVYEAYMRHGPQNLENLRVGLEASLLFRCLSVVKGSKLPMNEQARATCDRAVALLARLEHTGGMEVLAAALFGTAPA